MKVIFMFLWLCIGCYGFTKYIKGSYKYQGGWVYLAAFIACMMAVVKVAYF